ncbi:odorant receptor 23a isoform X1 [Drosophila albomicans]|uniref:Odorant receptor n=1 Tax=Drosophila albomicans TaxID=7291 RepID=A0A6P8WKC7_DROAB|nr:odorant receptor 23a isoform X1 [Drosophila albomicans]
MTSQSVRTIKSVYFPLNWRVWQLLGAVALNDRAYESHQFWFAVVLNLLATVVYPMTLLMAMFSFELPLDNLMNFNISITSVATVVKFLMYTRRMQKLNEFEQVLVELDKRVDHDIEAQHMMHKSMCKELSLITKMYIATFCCVAITTELPCLFIAERTLPFPTWFPLDWKSSLSNYVIALTYQFLSITTQILQNFVDDLFPPLTLCLVARNCELLINRIGLIGYDNQSDERTNEQLLFNCIRDQQQLYRLLDLAMDMISGPMLVQFIVIAIILGTAMCGLVFYVETQQDRFYYIFFIYGLFMQIFPICYYGTLVEDVFERLHYAVFNSNWVEQSIVYRRTAIIFAQRTQKFPKLLAGNVIPIALTTFLGNCKGAYSFFTLIADSRKTPQ